MNINDAQVQKFIRQSMVARIATLSRNGRPSITPLYFSLAEGHIWLGTANWTLAAREVGADPRVSVLFQHERNPKDHRILRISGAATVRTDPDALRIVVRGEAFKYVLPPGALWNRLLHWRLIRALRRYHAQSADKGTVCAIDVTPVSIEFLEA